MDLERLTGLHWHASGQMGLSGELLRLFTALDLYFANWARGKGCLEHHHQPLLSMETLNAIDYIRNFPQLVTLPITIVREAESLSAFAESCGKLDHNIALNAPQAVLAPAACFAVYDLLRGKEIQDTLFTLRGTCFRCEKDYQPLRRQWCFTMREWVFAGNARAAEEFACMAQAETNDLLGNIGLSVTWTPATDPFYQPEDNPKALYQKMFPNKFEMLWDGLALGSINRHLSFFGQAFNIHCRGSDAHTVCVAFGLERCLFAALSRWGERPQDWPKSLCELIE